MSTCFAYIANKLPYYPIHFIAILVVLNSLMIRESHAQCAVGPDDIVSYDQTLSLFSDTLIRKFKF